MRFKALQAFVAIVILAVSSVVIIIQSRAFAVFMKGVISNNLPKNYGLGIEFADVSIIFFPPGFIINNPKISLKNDNILKLPEGSELKLDRIETTFQFFQLMTGSVNINAINFYGADVALDLDKEFFAAIGNQGIAPKKNKPTNWWDSLVQFNFRSVGILNSNVDITIEAPSFKNKVRVVGNAREISISRSSVARETSYNFAIDLSENNITIDGVTHNLAMLKASMELHKDRLQFRSLNLQEGDILFHSNGIINGNLLKPKQLTSDISFIFRGSLRDVVSRYESQISKLLPDTKSLDGKVRLEGNVSGDLMSDPKTWNLKLNIEGDSLAYKNWLIKKASTKLALINKAALFESVNIVFDDGGAIKSEKIEADLTQKQPLKFARLQLSTVDIRKALGSYVNKVFALHLNASGNIELRSNNSDHLDLTVLTEIKVSKVSVDNQSPKENRKLHVIVAVPEADLSGSFALNSSKIKFNKIAVKAHDTNLNLTGDIDFKEGFNLSIDGDINLADISKIAEVPVRGKGKIHWIVAGLFDDVKLIFSPVLDDAYFLKLNLGKLSGKIIWRDRDNRLLLESMNSKVGKTEMIADGYLDLAAGHDDVSIDARVIDGSLQDFDALVSEYLAESVPWYPHELTGDLAGLVVMRGKISPEKLSIEGDMVVKNVRYLDEIINDGKFHAGYRYGGFVGEKITLRKRSGSITGDISFSPDSILNYSFETEGLMTSDLDHIAGLGISYIAPLNIASKATGKIGALEGNLNISLGAGYVKNNYVAPSTFFLNATKSRFAAALSVMGGQATGKVDFAQSSTSDGTLVFDANSLNLAPLLVALNPALNEDATLESHFKANANLKFYGNELSKATGDLSIDSFSLQKRDVSIKLAAPIQVKMSKGDYNFSKAKIVGSGAEILISGNVTSNKILYDVRGDLPLGLFEFITPEIAMFKGNLGFRASVEGSVSDPVFTCVGHFNGADFRLLRVEQSFEGIAGNIDWSNNLIKFSDLSARLGGGLVTGKGTAKVYLSRTPSLSFVFDLNNPKFKVYPFSFIKVAGRLAVDGEGAPYLISGNIGVSEALIQENFTGGDATKVARSSQFLPKQNQNGGAEFHLFDLGLDSFAERSVFIKNDLFDAELKGRLKLVGTLESPRLLGRAEVLQGKILFNESIFAIQNGLVTFNNPVVLDPEFDMAASTDYKGYKINLYATGKPSDPKISFKSQPPLSQEDVVTLLTLGVTSSSYRSLRSQDRDAYTRDEVYSLLFSQSGINRGLKNKFGVNVGVDQAVNSNNAESAFRRSADTSLNVAPKVVIQKEILKNLNAKVGTTVGVGDNRQQDLNLEYQFGKNTSVTGVYEDQRGATARNSRTSMGVDLKFRWSFR